MTRTQAPTAELFITAPEHGIQRSRAIFSLAKGKRRDNPKILRLIYENMPPQGEPRNCRDMTPLMIASYHRNPRCLEEILKQPDTDIEATTIGQIEGFNKKFTAYSFSSRNSKCATILEMKGAQKIRPKLTDVEQQWLDDLREAKNARDLLAGSGALAIFLGLGPFAVAAWLAAGTSQERYEDIEDSRPESQLDTPAED